MAAHESLIIDHDSPPRICAPALPRSSTICNRQSAICNGFTLLEMLVVIGIIAILLVAIVPAVTSLSKSSGRKGAMSNLLGAIEQARVEAIKTGQPTYVVFAIFPVGTSQQIMDRYHYKSYAIFEDDPAGGRKQLTNWKTLPIGVSFRSKQDTPNDPADPAYPTREKHGGLTPLPTATFAFQQLSPDPTFPFLKFNASGEIESPPGDALLVVFGGHVDPTNSNSEVITGSKDSFVPPNPLAAEAISVSHLTGRAEPTASPTPTS